MAAWPYGKSQSCIIDNGPPADNENDFYYTHKRDKGPSVAQTADINARNSISQYFK
jgi:hypothetical protein